MKKTLLVTAILFFMMGLAHTGYATQLLLWNKLGSNSEVQNSEVGGPGTIYGTMDYQPAKDGNGAHAVGTQSYVWFQNQDFSALKQKGGVELWIKPDYDFSSMPRGDIFTLEGANRAWNGSGIGIQLLTVNGGLFFQVLNDTEFTTVSLPEGTGGNLTWNAGELHHIALSWDGTGTEMSGDGIRLYFDENLIYSKSLSFNYLTDPFGGELDLSEETGVLGLFKGGYGASSSGGWSNNYYFQGVIDDVKVWDTPLQYTPVPEPATLILLGLGIAGLIRRKMRK